MIYDSLIAGIQSRTTEQLYPELMDEFDGVGIFPRYCPACDTQYVLYRTAVRI